MRQPSLVERDGERKKKKKRGQVLACVQDCSEGKKSFCNGKTASISVDLFELNHHKSVRLLRNRKGNNRQLSPKLKKKKKRGKNTRPKQGSHPRMKRTTTAQLHSSDITLHSIRQLQGIAIRVEAERGFDFPSVSPAVIVRVRMSCFFSHFLHPFL